jgi:hypothetical protein
MAARASFDDEVSEPPPYRHVFRHPDDDREIPAVLQHKDGVVAIYRADLPDPT